ncbi:MAG: hypothetical protein OEY93_11610 [Anaerolineae bacterium]|nr:hypothetical protein [Anaerolineae bacterium]
MNEIQKVTAYITREDQLLVLHQPDSTEVGIQVPAGTLKPEETGLAGFPKFIPGHGNSLKSLYENQFEVGI